MDSQDFRDAILAKRPHYAKSRIPVIDALANKGNKNSEYNQFGPIYELYIYAFTLGLKKGLNLPLPPRNLTKEFNPIGQWKRDSKLVDFLLMIIFTRCEEIGFSWNELEDMEEKEMTEVISNITSFIESYANGGLDFLQKEWEHDKLINSHYLFVDLMAENSVFKEPEETQDYTINIGDSDEEIIQSTSKMIQAGESQSTEFKSTLRVNLHTDKPDVRMEHTCMKSIASFLNSNGGTLLIGVSDKKKILGLDSDFNSFSNKDDLMDEFQKHLDNKIEAYFGNAVYSLITLYYPMIDNKIVCRIDISRSKKEPVLLINKMDGNKQEFYIRRSASTKALSLSEMIKYKEIHWG